MARVPCAQQKSEAADMAVLFVRCPVFGREFSVGVETDAASLELIPDTPAEAQCPYCGANHRWSKRDARLSETGVPTDPVAVAE
jgi:hypothetical protein